MTAAQTDRPPAHTDVLLEDPNSPLVIAGQILCVVVPLAVWFAPLPLAPVTKHGFAIVGFMVVAWITRAMDYALAGFIGCFLFWALGIVKFPVAFSGFANDTAWFLFGALLLGVIATRSGIARRLAYFIMLRIGITYPRILLGLILTDFLLTFIVPSGIARVVIMASRQQHLPWHVSGSQLHREHLRQDDHRGSRLHHRARSDRAGRRGRSALELLVHCVSAVQHYRSCGMGADVMALPAGARVAPGRL